ncbi:hypothetical protein DTO207G8_7822 [Paecilomyces variotii]|nr:hypothetical protein DTO207G8_7822 [Paecilomyces variotii]
MTTTGESPPTRIRILTLNCWGLKYLAKYRNERLSEIGRQLAIAEDPPEIVGLQECWTQEDYRSIRKQTKHILPYGKFYFSGIFGGGLAILSKWPIEDSTMYAYPLNGRPTAFFRGDWFVGKGVACARVRFGPGNEDVAEVFCTHLHAPYEREPNDSYICHRTAQAWEIAKLMRGAAERGHLVIGLGDFNMVPASFAHRLITTHAPVKDAWQVLHPDSSVGAAIDVEERKRNRPIPTAEYNLLENGATCDGAFNTWRWPKDRRKRLEKGEDYKVDPQVEDPKAKRLDYIFIGDGQYPPSFPPSRWKVESVKLSMTERHPTLKCSLSDHFAVEAVITRDATVETTTQPPPSSTAPETEPYHLSPTPSSTTQRPNLFLAPETYDAILAMIAKYVRRERSQRRWRLAHFLVALIVSIGCFVAVWWTGGIIYVAFILTFVSTLSFAAGVLDGLIGGLFVSSELRALKEFEWEVRNAKRLALGGSAGDETEEWKI